MGAYTKHCTIKLNLFAEYSCMFILVSAPDIVMATFLPSATAGVMYVFYVVTDLLHRVVKTLSVQSYTATQYTHEAP